MSLPTQYIGYDCIFFLQGIKVNEFKYVIFFGQSLANILIAAFY